MEYWFQRRVLVTGGAGFVGSQLAIRLVREGALVTVLDNLFTGDLHNLEPIKGRYTFVQGSVTSKVLMDSMVPNYDVVFHLAVRNIMVSTHQPELDLFCNTGGTLRILMGARRTNTKVVYTSSVSIHGQARQLPINAHTPASLLSPYAVSKLAAEQYCSMAYRLWKVATVVVRLSNCYGPGQSPSNAYCGVIGKFLEAARKREPLIVYGSGRQTRDYVYVDDTVEALLMAAENPSMVGNTVALGTGHEESVRSLAQRVQQLCGVTTTRLTRKRDIDTVVRRVVDPAWAASTLGWRAKIRLGRGLAYTWKWLQDETHPDA